MLLSLDFDFTDDPAKDGAKTSLCLVHLPAAALIITNDASCPPLGIVIVRMSPRTIFYLSVDRLHDGNTVAKGRVYSRP